MHVNTGTHYVLRESVCEEISWFLTFLYLCVCVCVWERVCKHGPATYMVTKPQSRAHTSDIKHTYGPQRPIYLKFTPWRELYRSDTPTPRSRLAEALGNVEDAGCDWWRGGVTHGADPAPTGPHPEALQQDGVQLPYRVDEEEERREKKRKQRTRPSENLCAVSVDWKGKFGARWHGSTLSPLSLWQLRASASD